MACVGPTCEIPCCRTLYYDTKEDCELIAEAVNRNPKYEAYCLEGTWNAPVITWSKEK